MPAVKLQLPKLLVGLSEPADIRVALGELSGRQRMKLRRFATLRAHRYWQTWIGIVFLAIYFIWNVHLMHKVIARSAISDFQVFSCMTLGIVSIVAWGASIMHFQRIELRKLFPGRCLSCGYDLRATRARCPECGTIPKVAQSTIPS